MEHAWDFYKPNMLSEYPVVDGKLSIVCYLRALDYCYRQYQKKFAEKNNGQMFTVDNIDFGCFHSPFTKLVRKSFARLVIQVKKKLISNKLAPTFFSYDTDVSRFPERPAQSAIRINPGRHQRLSSTTHTRTILQQQRCRKHLRESLQQDLRTKSGTLFASTERVGKFVHSLLVYRPSIFGCADE